MSKLLIALMCIYITFFVASCGCPDDGENGIDFTIISVDLSDNSQSEWRSDFSQSSSYSTSDLASYLRNNEKPLVEVDEKVIIGNTIVDLRSDDKYTLPGNVSECVFKKTSTTVVCISSQSDTLFNSFLNTSISVREAKNILVELSTSYEASQMTVLETDTLLISNSRFTSENRYELIGFHNPKYSEGDYFNYQRSTEIREVVFDSTGSVVNDVSFYMEISEYKYLEGRNEEVINYGPITVNEKFPDFAMSLLSGNLAYSYRDEVYVKVENSESWKVVGKGYNIRFFDQGDRMLFNSEEGYQVYTISEDILVSLNDGLSIQTANVYEQSERVFYLANDFVNVFEPEDERHRKIKSLNEYVTIKENKEGSSYSYYLNELSIFFDPKNQNRIRVVSNSSYSIYYTCG